LTDDIAIINLRDSLPLPAGLPANLRLIAPFSPFTSGYSIATPAPLPGEIGGPPAGSNGQVFNVVGYGRQGTGANGQQLVEPIGTKTLGQNTLDQTVPAEGPAALYIPRLGRNLPATPNLLEYDLDGGGFNVTGGGSIGDANLAPGLASTGTVTTNGGVVAAPLVTSGGSGYTKTPYVTVLGGGAGAIITANIANGVVTGFNLIAGGAGYANATIVIEPPPAPWLNEARQAQGDSGSPALVSGLANGSTAPPDNNPTVGGSTTPLQILGVASYSGKGLAAQNNRSFGTVGTYTKASAYNNDPANGNPAGFIWSAQHSAYSAILDMRLQVLGYAGQVQDPLTITVGRGTAAGVFVNDGPNLLIHVQDTAVGIPANFQYNGFYFNQPIKNADGSALIQSLALRGNDGGNRPLN
jgi:hypothetical protein